jgi:hypothetical protein
MGRTSVGALLAIAGGLFCFWMSFWATPAPQGTLGSLTALWTTGLLIDAALLIFAPFVASRQRTAGRIMLIVGAITLFASGIFFGAFTGAGLGAAAFDFVPGVAALIAAFFVGPPSQPEVARARQAEEQSPQRRDSAASQASGRQSERRAA